MESTHRIRYLSPWRIVARRRNSTTLNLDEFAVNLMESNGDRKRHALNAIRVELKKPFGETRPPLHPPSDWEAVTTLAGETERALRVGLIVSVLVQRIRQG